MLHIVIDARRIRDFGIGTYIRSLIHALGQVDRRNRYTIVTSPADERTIAGLPESFRTALYAGTDNTAVDHVAFPMFLRRLRPDLGPLPLNRLPPLVIKPDEVTISHLA